MTTVNSFSSLLTGLSELHRCAIQGMLESEECNSQCTIIYESTNLNPCDNCLKRPDGRSANIYNGTGPVNFSRGQVCPRCFGKGVIKIEPETENINLVVIWNQRDFINIDTVNVPEGTIQTLSVLSGTLPQLKRATSLVVGTDIENYERHKYERNGEPIPCGFGANNFLVTTWKKVQ